MSDPAQLPEGYRVLSDEETRALMDRSFLRALGPSWRQPNGAPPAWIPDSPEIIMEDLSAALDKAAGKA